MNRPQPRDGVAVVVGQDINALGVLRSLAAGNVRSYAVIVDRASPVGCSRHGTKVLARSLAGGDLVEALLRLAESLGAIPNPPVLFLTEERGIEAVAAQREAVAAKYRFTWPASDLLAALMHKDRFQALAERAGAPIPRSIRIRDASSLGLAHDLRYPVILKPAVRNYRYAELFAKAYKCATALEVTALIARILPVCDDLIVQEWIEGADSDIYFCLVYIGRGPNQRVAFCGRKLRSWPPRVGGTASCIAAPEVHAELSARTCAFFESVGFEGLGSMEFKRDKRDSEFYMVEPTVGRTDFQEEVATVNGVNIPLCVFDWENGRLADTGEYVVPSVAWFDADAVRRARGREAAAGMEWGRGPALEALFRWSDPLPALIVKAHPHLARLSRLNARMRAAICRPGRSSR